MGIFDDAKTVMIGNKEVQSIITSNGGVIYEKPSGYNLTLTADKSIIQTNELCTLSATLTNNNTPMAGETIFFYDSNNPPISYSTDGSHDFTVNVGDAFKLYYTSQSTASNSYCAIRDITNSISIYVHKEGNVSITETNISRTTTFNSFSYLKLENGILSNGDGDTCDLSSYTLDFDLVRINNSGTVYVEDDLIGVAITNVNGVATVGYTGKGTGDLNIKAYAPERIISSEIYLLEDCIIYDVTEYTAPQQFNNSMPLPSTFKIEYEAYYPSGTCASFLIVGETSNGGGMLVGKVVSTYEGYMIIARKNSNGSGDANAVYGSTIPRNNWISQTITYDGTNFNFNNGDMNTTNLNTVQLTRINSFATYYTTGKIRNIKIKPL